MQGIYNYIPETNLVSRVYSVAALLCLLFVLHVMLFCPWNMFCTFTVVLSIVCVHYPIWWFFCSSLISCFPGMLLIYCLSDTEIVPVTPIITCYLTLLLSHSTCAEFLLWGLCCCCCCFFVLFCHLLSQAFSSWYFSWTNNDPHHSGFKFHTAVVPTLCVMYSCLL